MYIFEMNLLKMSEMVTLAKFRQIFVFCAEMVQILQVPKIRQPTVDHVGLEGTIKYEQVYYNFIDYFIKY